LGTDHLDQPITTFVNPPSSATGVTRDGKKTSRLLPAEGGQLRAVAPQPRSESAGGADTSPEGDPSRRRGSCRESGDRDGGPASNREPELAAAMSGKPLPFPDVGTQNLQYLVTRQVRGTNIDEVVLIRIIIRCTSIPTYIDLLPYHFRFANLFVLYISLILQRSIMLAL